MKEGSRARSIRWRVLLVAVTIASAVCKAAGACPGAESAGRGTSLRQVATFDLPGPPGQRFDYLTFDDRGQYLFSAHLGAGLLHVIDIRLNAVARTVRGVPDVEGVAYIPEDRKVYTANWGENTIGVVVRNRRWPRDDVAILPGSRTPSQLVRGESSVSLGAIRREGRIPGHTGHGRLLGPSEASAPRNGPDKSCPSCTLSNRAGKS